MSIIKLEEPWAFFASEEITQGELEELQKHFVDDSNLGCNWCIDEWNGVCYGGGSDWHSELKYFDEDELEDNVHVYSIEELRDIIAEHLAKQPVEKLEDGVVYYVQHSHGCKYLVKVGAEKGFVVLNARNYIKNVRFSHYNNLDFYTKATPEQISHYEACVKDGKYVEPESITQFVVGKWYKWFQKDHGRTQKGKCANLYDSHFEMKPWICNSSEYVESGMFNLRDAESIELIENLSEIQDLLPDGHEDKWAKTAPKSERYLETMKFFKQLREPERSEAIANYDEEYDEHVPKSLAEALEVGFCWVDSPQGLEYWEEEIHRPIDYGSYFKKEELLVFGKYKVGDIVVLQVCTDRYPMFKVSKDSTPDKMIDETGAHSTNPDSFRPATSEEVEAYNQGVRNIADIKPKDYKEAVHCTTQKEWDFVLSKFNPRNLSSSKWTDAYESEQCLITVDVDEDLLGAFSPVRWFEVENYTILTFKQWCEKYGHSYEVVPEYVECIKSHQSPYYTVGKIYTWPNTISDSGKSNKVEVLKGSVWEFKPSTKEAYDKQQEKLKMKELLSKAKPTEIKPAKGMHVRCLKENSWSDGKTKVGQVFEIESVDWSGDMWVNNNSFAKERLGRGEFELLTDYKEEPWIAQVGDWVYTLPGSSGWGMSSKDEGKVFKVKEVTNNWCEETRIVLDGSSNPTKASSTIDPITLPTLVRKATQEEIDSVIKTLESRWPVTENVAWAEWTADNWYVEVSSQEEANAVIDAAAKMYDKPYDKYFSLDDEWKYVSLCCQDKKYSLLSRKFIYIGAKPRPITDFMQPEIIRVSDEIDCINSRPLSPKECYKPQQDELVIYKPKQTRLVEPGAVSASVSTTNLIIKSNSKYL